MTPEEAVDIRHLMNRLRGIYTVPVNDGAGLLNGKDTFTRVFEVPPINKEAANMIERLAVRVANLEQEAEQRRDQEAGRE